MPNGCEWPRERVFERAVTLRVMLRRASRDYAQSNDGSTTIDMLEGSTRVADLAEEINRAAQTGDVEKVKELLKENPDLLDSKNKDGWTPLHWAVSIDFLEMAQLLIKNHANVTTVAKDEETTPLSLALREGNEEMIKLIINNKPFLKL